MFCRLPVRGLVGAGSGVPARTLFPGPWRNWGDLNSKAWDHFWALESEQRMATKWDSSIRRSSVNLVSN